MEHVFSLTLRLFTVCPLWRDPFVFLIKYRELDVNELGPSSGKLGQHKVKNPILVHYSPTWPVNKRQSNVG